MTGFARALCAMIVVALTVFLVYASITGQVIADQLHVWQRVWGLYVWADAYSGFFLFSTLVYAFERRLGFTLGLLLLTCATGNMCNAAWLLWRGPELYRRIKGTATA